MTSGGKVVSKMQRFGLIALLIAGGGVVLVMLFLPAGPQPGGKLIGTWSMEIPDQGDGGVRLTFERNGEYRLSVPNRPGEVVLVEEGTWQTRETEENRLVVVRKTNKVAVQNLQGKVLEEKAKTGQTEWLIDMSNGDNLQVVVPSGDGKAHQFLLRRVQK
jgi:hypothetical protein